MVFETKILAHKHVADGTHEVTLNRPPAFTFCAGQYLQIALPKLITTDHKGVSRLFSIASSPRDVDELKIAFRVSGSGFKETLMSMPAGSVVQIEQAAGSFILPENITRPHVLVAGGIGITPFLSYLRQKMGDVWDCPITLLYGNQNPQSSAYLQELKLMSKQQLQFTLTEIYERPTLELFVKMTKKYHEAMWWVVGPPGMVATTINGLQLGGVLVSNIRTESFEGY